MQKGIALFSTLMILALVTILMSVALKNTTNIKRSVLKDKFLIQENLTTTDIVELIDTKIVKKLEPLKGLPKVRAQKVLFGQPIIIQDPVNNSSIEIHMLENDGKVNINFINSIDGTVFIKKIFNIIGVLEPELLIEILLANITNSNKYRDDYKIHLKNFDKAYGYITNKEQFDMILDIYVQNTNDQNSYNIDFEKFFNFYVNDEHQYNRLSSNELDINYIEVELIDSIIGLDNSVRKNIKNKEILFYEYSQLKLDDDPSKKKILEDHGFGFETNNILLRINTTSINNKIEYTLNYNLTTKKISNISMDRWIY